MNTQKYDSSENQEQLIFDTYSNDEKKQNSLREIPFPYYTRADQRNAMKLLHKKGQAFMLWSYWVDNPDVADKPGAYWISPAAIENEIGLTESQFRTAKNGLIECGFLTWNGKAWVIHARPAEVCPKPNEERQKAFEKSIESLVKGWQSFAPRMEPVQESHHEVVRKPNYVDCNDFDGNLPDFDFEY